MEAIGLDPGDGEGSRSCNPGEMGSVLFQEGPQAAWQQDWSSGFAQSGHNDPGILH